MAEHVLRTDLDGAAAARMKPGRTAGHDLESLHRRAARSEHRKDIGFRIKRVSLAIAVPVPADLVRIGEAAPHPAGGWYLVFGPVILENLADFELRDVAAAAVRIFLRGEQKPRN